MTYCKFEADEKTGLWTCGVCGFVSPWKSEKAPVKMCQNHPGPSLVPAVKKLGISPEDVSHYAQALGRWTLAGFPTRSQAEVERLYNSHCKPCEDNVGGKCTVCKCNVNLSRFTLVNKIKMRTENCPNGKWGEQLSDSDDRCVYLGDEDGRNKEDQLVYHCHVFGRCLLEGNSKHHPSCESCKQKLLMNDPEFSTKWKDPLEVVDVRREVTTSMRHLLAGRAAFLMGGGPSANDLPLELLARRGCWTMSVNNCAGHPRVRPQAFVCSDPPSKFSHGIWLDPGIAKFIPIPKMRGGRAKLRRKVDDHFDAMDKTVTECPNVWGFRRNSWLSPDDQFFLSDGACWGNHNEGVEKTGEQKCVCTMLLALRLLYHLGARTIFLLGVDFRMGPGYGYSFGQERDKDAVTSNNSQFQIVNDWLCRMVKAGTFERFGLRVFNCYERSGLRAFPYLPFEQAVEVACDGIEEILDLAKWYDPR